MRGTGGDDDAAGSGPSGVGVPEGGYAARRLRLREKEQQQGSSSGGRRGLALQRGCCWRWGEQLLPRCARHFCQGQGALLHEESLCSGVPTLA